MASPEKKHDFLDPPDLTDGAADYLGSLGHYRVIRELGKGGMGYVFLAEDTRLKRQIALKVMNQKIAATPGSRKRFISEARSMAAVHHDNVATIFEVGEYKGTPFMAMELLEGMTLEDFKTRPERPGFQELIRYAIDIARGLAAAHAQGIVHRDIKPANIWLDTKTDRIKILDFGLALAQTPVDQLSGRGAVIGTPGYLSPEQARSEPLDDRSDLYSTGVVLYELATGRLPLKSKTVAEQLISILAHAPAPLRSLNDKIPEPLADLIERLMRKEPRDRYSSAEELEAALEKVAVECESKTEVAQAINQLQMGLNQVVKKKSPEPEIATVIDAVETPNPFASLPDAIPVAVAAAPASPLSSGQPGASPLASGSSGTVAAPGKRPAKPVAEASNSKMIWVVVGVSVLVIGIAIPAVVFWSTSSAIARQQNTTEVLNVNVNPESNPNGGSQPQNNQASGKQNVPETGSPANGAPANGAPANGAPANGAPANFGSAGDSQGAMPDTAMPGTARSAEPAIAFQPSIRPTAIEVVMEESKSFDKSRVKWILGAQNGNGSFEATDPGTNDLKIPGWTMQRSGEAGWGRRAVSSEDLGNNYVFVGKGAELLLTSDPLRKEAQPGDIYRVGADLGGQGAGQTECTFFIGFEKEGYETIRYEIASVNDESQKLGPKLRRLRFLFAADSTVAGRKPFLELFVSNRGQSRETAIVDRLVMTVEPSGEVSASIAMAEPASDSFPESMAMPLDAMPVDAVPTSGQETTSSMQVPLRSVTLTTDGHLGADATVKKSSSSNNPLGEKSTLVVQTRNGRELQHVYLRFNLSDVDGSDSVQASNGFQNQGQKKGSSLKVANAELMIDIAMPNLPVGATIRLHAFNDPRSDGWPEKKIVWNNSISKNGLDALPTIAVAQVGDSDRQVILSDPELDSVLSSLEQKTVTLILSGDYKNSPIVFASREDPELDPPTLKFDVMK